ncbi:MAG: hypothetical protein AAGE52_31845 [Myxococcota bacterium]
MTRRLSLALAALDHADPPRVIRRYLESVGGWWRFDLEVSLAARRQAAELWRHRPALRHLLRGCVLHVVCDEHRRAYRRAAECEDGVPHDRWLARYPDLAGAIEHFVIKRAGRFRRPRLSLPAGLVWMRHLAGGERACRQLANVLRWAKRRGVYGLVLEETWEARLSEEERARINALLAPTYQVRSSRGFVDEDAARAMGFRAIVRADYAFAQWGDSWSEDDQAYYADVLARLPESVQHRVRRARVPLPEIVALAKKR